MRPAPLPGAPALAPGDAYAEHAKACRSAADGLRRAGVTEVARTLDKAAHLLETAAVESRRTIG